MYSREDKVRKDERRSDTRNQDGLGININFPLLYINTRPQLNPRALLEPIKPIKTHILYTANHPCFI